MSTESRIAIMNTLMISFSFMLALFCPGKTYAQFDQPLKDTLKTKVVSDQKAAGLPPKGMTFETPAWQHYKDSVFLSNYKWAKKLIDRQGFPGHDKVGEDGSRNFWLLVQHCDKWPEFQQQVLLLMEKELNNNNANPQDFAFLTDRVQLNTGGKQSYGTQVTYNTDSCQAIPRPLNDPGSVNSRRKLKGLGPLEEYLNMMSLMHFQMNKVSYEERGISQPKLLIVPKE